MHRSNTTCLALAVPCHPSLIRMPAPQPICLEYSPALPFTWLMPTSRSPCVSTCLLTSTSSTGSTYANDMPRNGAADSGLTSRDLTLMLFDSRNSIGSCCSDLQAVGGMHNRIDELCGCLVMLSPTQQCCVVLRHARLCCVMLCHVVPCCAVSLTIPGVPEAQTKVRCSAAQAGQSSSTQSLAATNCKSNDCSC